MTAHEARPWLVTGARGMLARDLLGHLAGAGIPAVAAGRGDLDITDRQAVQAAFAVRPPAVVVNCAAWTAVDAAEDQEAQALAVNGTGARLLAEACRASGSVLLQISTDYVFDGRAREPYPEYAPAGPRSAYGRTKLAGERAVLHTLPDTGYVVRTSWLYGVGGNSFVRTVIGLERERETLEVVDDQWGQPTWAADLAAQLVRLGQGALAGTAPAGVYHGSNGGATTWFAFCREIFRLLGADPARVRPVTSDRYARPAPRPVYSVLGHGRWHAAGMTPLRHWHAALAEALPAMRHRAAAEPAGPAGEPAAPAETSETMREEAEITCDHCP
ncbi:dTDP-4-dehydrorhamnose reductase [Streptomyces sp. DSM 41527]|uniref:dTDP-4-dehydrorhamnose reductase n=1 Tax=Streptomyces mooreae TaxID=3075523 RepID=A0ABU2T716_9ACTN|nr:dTDP-4-dehydrorhamnose reductase [Streptomyces sp. DSM 41527]MDT0456820.1 dTDP-4-dehydrorhamnose reductase [Streptomyces sp. DSM 41527]